MEQAEWMKMLLLQQELHRFSRAMLVQSQKQLLTASELEILSRLYLQQEGMTPLELSRQTGMKKEAVSRCLRRLCGQEFVRREKRPEDERSYCLTLTEPGREALDAYCGQFLTPMYALKRSMGGDFETLFRLIAGANARMEADKQ